MTREEAIKILVKLREHYCKHGIFEAEALNMAIKALSQEPISLNDINNALGASFRNGVRSVTQKSGKWIRWREEVQRGTHYMENVPHCKCSECDKEYDTYTSRFIKYCPNCGAKMVEPQESEEQTK